MLRSLFAKIFLCTLVIYPLSCGIGFSTLYLLSRPPPPPPPEIAQRVLLLLSVEVACCVLVSYLLARYLTRPLRNLHDAAIAFAGGDLLARSQEVKAERRDEVAELVRAFNSMADHISALIQAQRRFIVDVSHEIKSPLARPSLAAALARRAASPAAAEQFDRLEREIENASSLVRDLQVLSSLQDGGPLPRCEMFDLAALLAAAIDNVAFEWEGHPHGMRLTAPSEPVITQGDPAILQRAVENVLHNALFYTPKGTEVAVSVMQRGGSAHIEVRDYGPGVPEAVLPHLFDPFYRVDESRTRNTGGIGIGLAIVQRAVALQGGTVTAANADPSGLQICIDLPLAAADRSRYEG